MGNMAHQAGGTDCGVFAIAVATALAFGCHGCFSFHQTSMRDHLKECIEKTQLTPFFQF